MSDGTIWTTRKMCGFIEVRTIVLHECTEKDIEELMRAAESESIQIHGSVRELLDAVR